MKAGIMGAVLCFLPLGTMAAPHPDGILVKADMMVRNDDRSFMATGRVAVMAPNLAVTADEVTFDAATNSLTFTGNVSIHSGPTTLKAKNFTVDTEGRRVYTLAHGSVARMDATGPALSEGGRPLFEFKTAFPRTDTGLKR